MVEKSLTYKDFQGADEIFSTGNYSKVVPVTRIDNRTLPFGPLYAKATRTLLGVRAFLITRVFRETIKIACGPACIAARCKQNSLVPSCRMQHNA